MLTIGFLLDQLDDMYDIIVRSWGTNSKSLYRGSAYGTPIEFRDCEIKYIYALPTSRDEALVVFEIDIENNKK